MGFLDKISQKAAGFDDDYAYDDDFVDEYADEEYEEAEVSPIRAVEQVEAARIITVWVSSYRDVKDFAVEFQHGVPVILNLSDASDQERTRIVDFAVGLSFGLSGAFAKISDDVFLLTPRSMKLEAQGQVDTHDFNF